MTPVQHVAEVKRPRPVGYTDRAVDRYRHNRLVRAVAFALTLWLGLDYAAAGVCCQDDLMHGASESGWATNCPVSRSPTEPGRADTCFCCALVVGPVGIVVPQPIVEAALIPDVHPPDSTGNTTRPVPPAAAPLLDHRLCSLAPPYDGRRRPSGAPTRPYGTHGSRLLACQRTGATSLTSTIGGYECGRA